MFFCVILIHYHFEQKKFMEMASEKSSSKEEVTDFVASELPDQSLPSEKDTIQLALLIKSTKYRNKTALDSPAIGNIFSLKIKKLSVLFQLTCETVKS